MKSLLSLALFALLLVPAGARAERYSFDVHEKFVNITFESRMDIEDVVGTTNKVAGFVDLSGKGSFRFAVPVASLDTGIALRDEHLRSPHWLDVEKYPEIVFEGSSVVPAGEGKLKVSGSLKVHGVEKPLEVVVEARRIDKEQAAKLGLGEGRWLRVRGELPVKLSDFGVKIPEMAAAKVNDQWTVKVSLFGQEG